MLCIFSPPPCFHLLFFDWTMHPFTSSAAFSRILSVLFSQHLGKTNLCIAKTKATKKREKTSLCFLFIVLSVDKTKKKSQLFLPFLFSVTAEVSTVPSSELLCSHYWSQSCTFMAAGSKTCCQGDPWRRGGDTQKEEPQRRVLHVL